jgi:hypothetical protein
MGSPTRHGVDWGRVAPSPVGPKELDVSKPGGSSGGPFMPGTTQVMPVSVIDAFFEELPEPAIQPIIKTVEGQYTFTQINPNNPNLPGVLLPIQFALFTVPQQYVYIIVDVTYYATTPAKKLNMPAVVLGPEQLVGLARFDLTFSGRQAARFDMQVVSPYANTGTTPSLLTGWPFLETKFGPQRTTGFAVYARSSQQVLVTVYFDVIPQFLITKLGAHMHGYAVPEAMFDGLYLRRKLGM